MPKQPKMHAELRHATYEATLTITNVEGQAEFTATYPVSITPRRVRKMLHDDGWKVGRWSRGYADGPYFKRTATARRTSEAVEN